MQLVDNEGNSCFTDNEGTSSWTDNEGNTLSCWYVRLRLRRV
jgi:hypothetical protein